MTMLYLVPEFPPHPVKQGAVTAWIRPLGRQKWEVFGVEVCR